MYERTTRWIIIGTAAVLWVAIPLTAAIGLALHWYLAIWLATALASLGVLIYMHDSMARTRDAQRRAEEKAARDESVKVLCETIDDHAHRVENACDKHAGRMETATRGHGDRLHADVFTLDRWLTNSWRGETLAKYDAAREAEARRAGSDTGPMPIINSR